MADDKTIIAQLQDQISGRDALIAILLGPSIREQVADACGDLTRRVEALERAASDRDEYEAEQREHE